jgi:alpha-tubulin suppressor-like RCC1 family protein
MNTSYKLHFSGLNIFKRSIDSFTLDYFKNDTNFDNIYATFNSLVYFNKNNLFKLNFILAKFEEFQIDFLENDENIYLIESNSDFIWILTSKKRLFKVDPYSNEFFQIGCLSNCELDGLILSPNDINFYVFDAKLSKCVFQYEDFQDKSLEKSKMERELGENQSLSIKLDYKFFKDEIDKVRIGREHVFLISKPRYQLYSFGIGTKGQLGHGTIDNCLEPKLVESFDRVKDVSCGGWHTCIIDPNKNAYLCGWNSNGQSSELDETIVSNFNLLSENIKFKKASLGSRHSTLIDIENNLWTFGWNKYKQCFHDKKEENITEPEIVEKFKGKVVDVKCGPWYTIVLTL